MPDSQGRAPGAHHEQHAAARHHQQHAAGPNTEQHAAGGYRERHAARRHDEQQGARRPQQAAGGHLHERDRGGEPAATPVPGQDWLAPAASGPVRAVVSLPGSKSITNRALVLAAIADGPSLIQRPLRARDTLLMAAALRALGAGIEEHHVGGDGAPVPSWRVTPFSRRGQVRPHSAAAPSQAAATAPSQAPKARRPREGPVQETAAGHSAGDADTRAVDVGNAGTVLRFLPPVATLMHGHVAFDGDPRARERPVGPLIMALRQLGASIDDGGRGGLPFTVRGRGFLAGGTVTLDASGSSQLVSALLLAGARFQRGVEVRHQGPPIPSSPHIAMTIGMLRDAGARVEATGQHAWRVHPGPLHARCVDVEPDLSNAAPFLAAALVTGGAVTVRGWPTRTTQPGDVLRDLLAAMGASCELASDGLTVRGTGPIHGITADLRDVSELVPVLTALAALASSPSRFTGIAHMRTHETDRLAALAREINALGGQVTELADGLAVTPAALDADGAAAAAGTGGSTDARAHHAFATYDDHRLVMAAAVLGLAVPGLRVANAATVGKTLPGFTQLWTEMLGSSH